MNYGTDYLQWALLCTELGSAFLLALNSCRPTAGFKYFVMLFSTAPVANQGHLKPEEGNGKLQCVPHESHSCSLDSRNMHCEDLYADACAWLCHKALLKVLLHSYHAITLPVWNIPHFIQSGVIQHTPPCSVIVTRAMSFCRKWNTNNWAHPFTLLQHFPESPEILCKW